VLQACTTGCDIDHVALRTSKETYLLLPTQLETRYYVLISGGHKLFDGGACVGAQMGIAMLSCANTIIRHMHHVTRACSRLSMRG
jgi:hypothetical protein